jgi:glycosyltransferase involved in cell wall biosynthesis
MPHGVPATSFRWPGEVTLAEVPPRAVKFITSGLIRPGKGIEHVLAAFAQVKKVNSDFAYVVCGADHPGNPKAQDYRSQLLSSVNDLRLKEHVFFVNRFLGVPELIAAIQACDVGILAYTGPHQSSSGVLALTLSCGRPVIASDFQHAKAILNERTGILVTIGDVSGLAAAIKSLASNIGERQKMSAACYDSTRSWTWLEVAQKHFTILLKASCEVGVRVPQRP